MTKLTCTPYHVLLLTALAVLSACQPPDASFAQSEKKHRTYTVPTVPTPLWPMIKDEYELFYGDNYKYRPDTAAQIAEYIRCMHQDRKGDVWYGTSSGACRDNGQSFMYLTPSQGMSGIQVNDMAEDAEGHMWFATLGGVSTFDGTTVTTYTVADGLPHTDAFSILIDRTGAVWVGTTGGVCRMDPRSAKRFMPVALPEAKGTDDQFQGTHNKVVWRMKEDRHGRIWFATNGAGIVCIDGMKVSRLTTADGLLDDRVPDLTFDAQGNLWYITMRSGIGRYDGQRFKNYTDADDVELKGGWCIDVDRKGNIWFNGFGQGVYRFDGTRFMAFSRKDGLMQLSVQSLLFTSDGRSFFGTGAGLYQLRDGRFFNFTKNNGC